MKCELAPTGAMVGTRHEMRCSVCGQKTACRNIELCKMECAAGPQREPQPKDGPGTQLKKLLSLIGITAKSCKCNGRAKLMDRKGCDWCAENEAMIVGWLREEAESRGLPFVEFAAKRIIRLAAWRARKLPSPD